MATQFLITYTLICIATFIEGIQGIFSPNVTVLSCTSHRVVVQLENAAEGGLIYIQGRGSACSRATTSDKMDYEFEFHMCGIQYDAKFRVIVQQNPHYQTGYDKVVPVMCLVDTGDLFVTGVIFPEERLDTALNKTVRPTVSMRIMTDTDGAAVQEVTLDDKVKLSLTLDDPYRSILILRISIMDITLQLENDFDIKAKDCTAALIPILQNECSSDEELFPNFEKKTRGNITSTFNAFQPTNLGGNPDVDVSFTCSVAVCKGQCQQTVCGEIVGWGRKKRDSDDDIFENVTVGITLRVKTPHVDAQKTSSEEYCAEKVVVTTVTTFTVATLIFSWIVCACVMSKLRNFGKQSSGPKKPSALRRMSERNINFAKNVGRRLSTMLNIPVGYDMRDPRMMDSIPDFQPTPRMNRRESVTVSYVDVKTNDDEVNHECVCRLRKSFVHTSVQTESASVKSFSESRDRFPSLNSVIQNAPQMQNPITSLSIKSIATNSHCQSKIKSNKETTNNGAKAQSELKKHKSVSDVYANIVKTTDCIVSPVFCKDLVPTTKADKSDTAACIYYTADEVPMNREVCLFTPPADKNADAPWLKPSEINIKKIVDIIIPGGNLIPDYIDNARFCKNDNVNDDADDDDDDDVFISTFTDKANVSRDGTNTPTRDYESIFEPSSLTSNTTSNDGSSIPPRDYETASQDTSMRSRPTSVFRTVINTYANKQSTPLSSAVALSNNSISLEKAKQNNQVYSVCSEAKHRKGNGGELARLRSYSGSSLNCALSVNDHVTVNDEPVYEPIEFGAQVKRERKYSTHV